MRFAGEALEVRRLRACPSQRLSIVSRQANEGKTAMDKIESLNHTKWDCKYHVVFIAKYRRNTPRLDAGSCERTSEKYSESWRGRRKAELKRDG